MTLSTTVECGTSRENSIVFSAITNDAGIADQAYHKCVSISYYRYF